MNWGDLFFDLFYVAAAYNLSYIIKTDTNFEGLLYFCGCFFATFYNFWQNKLFYDARFQEGDDILHVLIEILQLCCLALAVLHIRPVKYMSHGSEDVSMFAFSLANLMGVITTLFKIFETGFIWCNGQTEVLRYMAITDALWTIFPCFTLMLIATISSGVVYFGSADDSNGSDYRFLADAAGTSDSYGSDFSSVEAESESLTVNHLPIFLCFILLFTRAPFQLLFYSLRSKDDFKSVTVPMNIGFVIHRFGEWIMLMLGESVLSLLIIDVVEDRDFYITFFTGVISVVLLQFLHFKSQPHHAKDHAMRKSRPRGLFFGVLMLIYSAALIVVGVCYKMLLTEYSKEEQKEQEYAKNVRLLAGGDDGGDSAYSTEERQLRIATLFGGSLALVFACLDLMSLAHNGVGETMDRCHEEKHGKIRIKGLMMVGVTRLALIALIASTFKIVTTPEYVALFGLGAIIAQIGIRFIGNIYFPSGSSNHANSHEEEHGPNSTHGDAEAVPSYDLGAVATHDNYYDEENPQLRK